MSKNFIFFYTQLNVQITGAVKKLIEGMVEKYTPPGS